MLKKLKSLFIIEEEITDHTTLPSTAKQGSQRKEPEIPDLPVDPDVKAPDKFINSLLKAIEANNMEGFDYLEYRQSVKSLENMDMDENTRFNSAFAMARTMGAQKGTLVNSAKHYLKVLDEEKAKFLAAYAAQQARHVHSREEKLLHLQSTIEKKMLQIKKLQDEIKQHESELEKKRKEMEEAATKVALTRDQFFAAHHKVFDQIETDIEKMTKYLTT